jgi:hypothetical protein
MVDTTKDRFEKPTVARWNFHRDSTTRLLYQVQYYNVEKMGALFW